MKKITFLLVISLSLIYITFTSIAQTMLSKVKINDPFILNESLYQNFDTFDDSAEVLLTINNNNIDVDGQAYQYPDMDRLVIRLWENKAFTFDEAKSLFDTSVYLHAINKENRVSEIKNLIYNMPYRAFVETDNGVYVLTGNGDIWKNSVDEIEVLSIDDWKEVYSKPIPLNIYCNNNIIKGAYLKNDLVHFPLRATLEGLGINVVWEPLSKTVVLSNNYIRLIPDYSINSISGVYIENNRQIQISNWSPGIGFSTLNDRIYIPEQAIYYILKCFDNSLSINIADRSIRIR